MSHRLGGLIKEGDLEFDILRQEALFQDESLPEMNETQTTMKSSVGKAPAMAPPKGIISINSSRAPTKVSSLATAISRKTLKAKKKPKPSSSNKWEKMKF